jgi:Protein phosphatase 2C
MTASLPLRWQAFSLWKRGNAAEDYEDAAAGDLPSGRFAVADGASEASFAAIWARQLVSGFVTDPGKPWRSLGWVGPLRERWAAEVDGLALPWYAEEKRELGAFATFLGLVFRPRAAKPYGYWRALAVGDCCLFHTRGDRLVRAFPMTQSADFGNRPRLLGSRSGSDALDAQREQALGRWQQADRFLLMTDALAQWFLLRTEQKEEPLGEIRSLLAETSPEEAFAGWVEERRNQALLRNDDVTLILVDVEPEACDSTGCSLDSQSVPTAQAQSPEQGSN